MDREREYLCHALDHFDTFEDLQKRIKNLSPYVGCFKVGLEAHTVFGARIIDEILENDRKVFLDLKFYDIPATVYKAVKAASNLGVHHLNVHALGCRRMLEAAREGVESSNISAKPKLIGVTMLTAHSEEEMHSEMRVDGPLEWQVLHLATMAKESGLDGIVCSPLDLPQLTDKLPEDFFYITPGVRMGGDSHDQTRVATPGTAIKNGSSLLVVGRALSECSPDEQAIRAKQILQEISNHV